MNKEIEILSAEHNSKLVDDLRIELTKIDESSKYLSPAELSSKRMNEIFCYLYAIDNAYDSPYSSDISNLKKLKESGILSTNEYESKINQINAAKTSKRNEDILEGTFIMYITSHMQQLVDNKLISEKERASIITQYLENIMANFKINKSLNYIHSLKAHEIITDDEYVILKKILMKKRKKKSTKITICASIFIIIIAAIVFWPTDISKFKDSYWLNNRNDNWASFSFAYDNRNVFVATDHSEFIDYNVNVDVTPNILGYTIKFTSQVGIMDCNKSLFDENLWSTGRLKDIFNILGIPDLYGCEKIELRYSKLNPNVAYFNGVKFEMKDTK